MSIIPSHFARPLFQPQTAPQYPTTQSWYPTQCRFQLRSLLQPKALASTRLPATLQICLVHLTPTKKKTLSFQPRLASNLKLIVHQVLHQQHQTTAQMLPRRSSACFSKTTPMHSMEPAKNLQCQCSEELPSWQRPRFPQPLPSPLQDTLACNGYSGSGHPPSNFASHTKASALHTSNGLHWTGTQPPTTTTACKGDQFITHTLIVSLHGIGS